MDFRFTELMTAADIIVNDSMKIKPDEKVLIVTDTRVSEYFGTEALVQAIMGAALLAGADPSILLYTARNRAGMALPALAELTIKNADAIICVNTYHFMQANVTREALSGGARIMCLPGGLNVNFEGNRNDDKIYRILPRTKEEFNFLADLTTRVGSKFIGHHKVHVTTELGTDLTLEVGPELLQNVCSGYCSEPGTLSFFPTGQLAIGVLPGTANGTVYIDGSLFPMQRLLSEPVVYTVKDGYVINIDGGKDAEEFKRIAAACEYPGKFNVAEIGMGLNPKGKLQGESFEDERLYGSAHLGIGSNIIFGGDVFTNGFHCDGIIKNATVEIDGECICRAGNFLV